MATWTSLCPAFTAGRAPSFVKCIISLANYTHGSHRSQLLGGRRDTYRPAVGHFTDEGARGLAQGLQRWPLCGSQDRARRRLRRLGQFTLLFSCGFPVFFRILLLLYLFIFFTCLVLREHKRKGGTPQMTFLVMNRTQGPGKERGQDAGAVAASLCMREWLAEASQEGQGWPPDTWNSESNQVPRPTLGPLITY